MIIQIIDCLIHVIEMDLDIKEIDATYFIYVCVSTRIHKQ